MIAAIVGIAAGGCRPAVPHPSTQTNGPPRRPSGDGVNGSATTRGSKSAVCSARGRVAPGTAVFDGTARILDPDETHRAEQAIRRRYGLPAKILPILYTIRDKLRHRTFGPIIGLEITLDGRRQE